MLRPAFWKLRTQVWDKPDVIGQLMTASPTAKILEEVAREGQAAGSPSFKRGGLRRSIEMQYQPNLLVDRCIRNPANATASMVRLSPQRAEALPGQLACAGIMGGSRVLATSVAGGLGQPCPA